MILLTAVCSNARSASIAITASRDNTIFQNSVNNSAGGGSGITIGTGGMGVLNSPRRGLITFDVAGNVPAGAIITDAELTMYLGLAGPTVTGQPISLHRLTADWGEGTAGSSSSSLNMGDGFPASAGDATWNQRRFGSASWTNPGAVGDFDTAASSTTSVGRTPNFPYFWRGLAANAQMWLDSPASNFGWIIINDDESFPGTARTFYSKDSDSNSFPPPTLTITYNVIPEPISVLILFSGVPLCFFARK